MIDWWQDNEAAELNLKVPFLVTEPDSRCRVSKGLRLLDGSTAGLLSVLRHPPVPRHARILADRADRHGSGLAVAAKTSATLAKMLSSLTKLERMSHQSADFHAMAPWPQQVYQSGECR